MTQRKEAFDSDAEEDKSEDETPVKNVGTPVATNIDTTKARIPMKNVLARP